jgi:hypothetical protein
VPGGGGITGCGLQYQVNASPDFGGTLAAACDDFWWPAQRVDLITVGLPE